MRLDELYGNDWSPVPYYHGSHVQFDGPPRPSPSGMYGPGFYLSKRKSYAAGHGPVVHEFRIRGKLATNDQLNQYRDIASAEGYRMAAKYKRACELLAAEGYTGIEDHQVTNIFDVANLQSVTGDLTEDVELDMSDAARMQRAKELGFTVTAFHGTKAKFNEFDVEKGKPSVMGGYAPHFADSYGEADGYRKEAGRGAKVLACLLRVKKPLIISFTPGVGKITPAEYKRITGKAWDGTDPKFPPSGRKALDDMMWAFGWTDHRANWTNAYKVLKSKGYDGLFYPDVAADHTSGQYGKYIVFDPKNVRLIDAAFDPAKSDSADLRA